MSTVYQLARSGGLRRCLHSPIHVLLLRSVHWAVFIGGVNQWAGPKVVRWKDGAPQGQGCR